jgi:hypothetical protein
VRLDLLLILPPVVWLLLVRADEARVRRAGPALGPRIPLKPRRFVLAVAGLFLAVLAVMGPAWGTAESEVPHADIVVCLDVSRSMLARDVEPDRLSRAKGEIRTLAEGARGDRLGLVVFAGEARAMVPLTEDMTSFAELLDLADPTSVGKGGTDLGAALEKALEVLGGRRGAVILFTDGEDLGGRGLAAARLLGERGVEVHCVGLGTELGSKIATEAGFVRDRSGEEIVSAMDAAGLRSIAGATGGTSGGRAPAIAATRRAAASERRENRYQWFLAGAVLLWLVDLGNWYRVRFAGVFLAFAAGCGSPYEDTLDALRAGDLDRAVAAAEGTEWHAFVRGNAAFAGSEAAEQLDLKIALAENAVAAWRLAAMTRDWPEARRNVERGLLRLRQLYEKRSGREPKPPEPKPPPPEPRPGREDGPETEAKLEKGEIAEQQVLRLLEIVREKERRKLAERRARLGAPQPGVEKDW